MIKTIFITNDPGIATIAQECGVSRIMVDLETFGKKERQASRKTFISTHQKEDISKIRAVLKRSELIVRINPWHNDSISEINYAIQAGADIIMLPMITQLEQLNHCLHAISGRVKLLPLIETKYSMDYIEEIATYPAIDELYIGLNDLHLELQLSFLFEPLALGLIDTMAAKIKAHHKPFGFGGIAALGSNAALPAECILGEHVRLGSSCVILSSQFCRDIDTEHSFGLQDRFEAAMTRMKEKFATLQKRSKTQEAHDRANTNALIAKLAAR